MLTVMGGNSASTGYNLTRSLRFRASASASLSRTPSVAGNRQIFTYSAWVKRGTLDATFKNLFYAYVSTSDVSYISFNSSNQLTIATYNGGSFVGELVTTQVFRDPSAWYHIVIAVDTTQATASNRIKMYVNGSQITAFATATYPPQNTNFYFNAQYIHRIAASDYPAAPSYFDGYHAEFNWIGGQALTPSSFGSTNATTGVWQPARYAGTYGTNGFYLPFTDNSALTTSSNVGLGKDFSGNGNYWTTNNISITSGVTYDSMTDVPTLTSPTASNFPTLNPLNNVGNSYLYAANLSRNGGDNYTISTMGMPSGKWYAEVTITTVGTESSCGIATAADVGGSGVGNNAWSWGYLSGARKYNNGSSPSYGTAFSNGDIVGIAFDNTIGTLTFYLNGVSQGAAFTGLAAGTYFFAVEGRTSGTPNNCSINFGQRPFAYTPPTGFVALNTYNLPTSTIVKGNTVMDATLYTGTAAALNVVNAAAFKPDLVWIKNRSNTGNHGLIDSVRGRALSLYSDLTSAEGTSGSTQDLTSFNSNGFSLGTQFNFSCNASGNTYVGWQWQAGQGSSSSNTSGTITSTVSVNASAGFSVVTATSPASGNAFTLGHGLGVAPAFIISKSRSGTGNWSNYHVSTGAGGYLLFTTAAYTANTDTWNNTAPTSSLISTTTNWWGNSANLVFYCWTPIAGYSAFGSYTGNGSTDGPFVYTGFRPKFVLIKLSSSAGQGWFIYDSARNLYNVEDFYLLADSSAVEGTFSGLDFLSNGFKIRNSGNPVNLSTATYIYAAFAENPFKNSLAR